MTVKAYKGNNNLLCITSALLDNQKMRHWNKQGSDGPDLVYSKQIFRGKEQGENFT